MGRLTNFCALCYGFLLAFQRYLIFTATEDIVAGTLIASSTVSISFAAGDLITKTLSPFLARKISVFPSSLAMGFLWLTSYLLLVIADDIRARIAGVFVFGLSNGFVVVVMVLMLARLKDIETTTSFWQVGGNSSSFVVGILYTGLTVWQCVSPRLTLGILYPIGALLLVIYPLMAHKINKDVQTTQYELVASQESDSRQILEKKSCFQRLDFCFQSLPYAIYYFLNHFSYYLAANAVLTVLTFPSSSFPPRDHYQYYRLTGDIGTLLGTSLPMVTTYLGQRCTNSVHMCKLWLPVSISVGHLLFFAFAAWYRFLPSFGIVLVLCATHGVLFGYLTVRIIVAAGEHFVRSSERGFAMSISEAGLSLGRLFAGLFGIFVEEYFRDYCTNELLLGKYCLARFSSSVGWDENEQCTKKLIWTHAALFQNESVLDR